MSDAFYGFETLNDEADIKRRRKLGRVGALGTSIAALGMGWLTANAPLFEVAESEFTNPVAVVAAEVVSRAPQGALTVILGGLTVNFSLGAHSLTRRLNEVQDYPEVL